MDSIVFKQAGKKLDYCDNQQIKGNYFIGFFFLPVIFQIQQQIDSRKQIPQINDIINQKQRFYSPLIKGAFLLHILGQGSEKS